MPKDSELNDLKKDYIEIRATLKKLEPMPRKYFEEVMQKVKKLEDARGEIQSQEQTIKRLERQMEILQKDLAALKKDALTEVDIRPLKKLLK